MSQFVPLALPSRCKTYGEQISELIKIRSFVGRDSEIIASNSWIKHFYTIDNEDINRAWHYTSHQHIGFIIILYVSKLTL